MSDNRKKALSYLGKDPNEFQIADDTINQITEKKENGDIDPYTAGKRIQKIHGAFVAHKSCLEDRKKDCYDTYINLFKTLKNITLNSSNLDTRINASMKYFNTVDTLGHLPEMTAARDTIKDLKNQAATGQIPETDATNKIEQVREKMEAYKRCHIWAGSATPEEKADQYEKYDCTNERNKLKDFAMNFRPNKS